MLCSNCDQVQCRHITQADEKEVEDALNIYSTFQNLPCEDDVLPFLNDFQSTNLIRESNVINSFDQYVALGNNHFHGDYYADVNNDKFPTASSDITFSYKYFTSDLESNLVKGYVLIKTSSSSHYHLCSTICMLTI